MHLEVGGHVGLDLIEELAELARAVLRVAAADHRAGGDVKRSEQRRGAVARIVVGSPLPLPGPHRQHGLRAVQRLDLRLLINAQHQRAVGRAQVEADDVAHFPTNSGSVESLKVSLRCGCSPKARQMRWMVDGA